MSYFWWLGWTWTLFFDNSINFVGPYSKLVNLQIHKLKFARSVNCKMPYQSEVYSLRVRIGEKIENFNKIVKDFFPCSFNQFFCELNYLLHQLI